VYGDQVPASHLGNQWRAGVRAVTLKMPGDIRSTTA
jgi:hypothetical protein